MNNDLHLFAHFVKLLVANENECNNLVEISACAYSAKTECRFRMAKTNDLNVKLSIMLYKLACDIEQNTNDNPISLFSY